MIRQNFTCSACGKTEEDVICTSGTHIRTCSCGGRMEILWGATPRPWIGIHPRERAVVWYDPKTGRHATPGRNNVPMPSRYAKAGYERREFTTLRELDSFCKTNRLVNERANYNSNGRAFDDED
jgi:hypothetical protein